MEIPSSLTIITSDFILTKTLYRMKNLFDHVENGMITVAVFLTVHISKNLKRMRLL